MKNNVQYQLQILINQLLELSCCENDIKKILQKALSIIIKSTIANNVLKKGIIFLADEENKLQLIAYKNVEQKIINKCNQVPFGECICGKVAQTKEFQFVASCNSLHNHVETIKDHSHYAFPIMFNKEVYGVVTFYLKQHHKKNQDEIELIKNFSKTLGFIIYNKRNHIKVALKDKVEKRNEKLRKDISFLVAKKAQRRITHLKSISEYVYRLLSAVMDTSNFYVALLDKENNAVDFPFYLSEKSTLTKTYKRRSITNKLVEYIIESKVPFIKTFSELKKVITNNNIDFPLTLPKIIVSFPLKNEGVVIGLVTLKSYKSVEAFSKQDIELLDYVSTQLSYIIERDLWQKNLIEREKYYHELVECSHEVTGIVDGNGIIQYISNSVKPILDYNAHELVGKYFFDVVSDKVREKVIKNFNLNISQPKRKRILLIKLKAKNGTEKIIQFAINNQLKNKNINGIIFNAKDITLESINGKRLAQSQHQLLKQEANYRTIFNNANDGIIKINQGFKIIDSNKRMTHFLGFTKQEILSKNIIDIAEKSSSKFIKKQLSLLIKKKETKVIFENKLTKKNGQLIICKIYIKPIFNNEGEFDYFIAFLTNITKKKEAVLKTIELEHALDQSSHVIYADIKGNIIHANQSITSFTGYKLNELYGKSTKIFNSGYHPKSVFKVLWSTILNGNVWKGELRNVRKNGTIYWVFATIIPIKDINNEIAYFIAVQNEITSLKQSKDQQIKDVIDAQEKEKENFAKELHDGLGQMLLASKMNLVAIKNDIVTLDKSSVEIYNTSLKLLTDSIQEARNVSHGLMSRALIHFGLNYAINDIINNINSIHNIRFEYFQNIDKERFETEIEKGLYRILQELISNIIKHSEATSAEIRIEKINDRLHINVKDNGVGLNANILNPTKPMGIGIKNIETRITYLSGVFKINNQYKNGTEITMVVPIK